MKALWLIFKAFVVFALGSLLVLGILAVAGPLLISLILGIIMAVNPAATPSFLVPFSTFIYKLRATPPFVYIVNWKPSLEGGVKTVQEAAPAIKEGAKVVVDLTADPYLFLAIVVIIVTVFIIVLAVTGNLKKTAVGVFKGISLSPSGLFRIISIASMVGLVWQFWTVWDIGPKRWTYLTPLLWPITIVIAVLIATLVIKNSPETTRSLAVLGLLYIAVSLIIKMTNGPSIIDEPIVLPLNEWGEPLRALWVNTPEESRGILVFLIAFIFTRVLDWLFSSLKPGYGYTSLAE